MADKKKAVPDWMKDAIPVSDDEWRNQATPVTDDEWNSIFNNGPRPSDIDPSADAPPLIRMQVGALDKPVDRLAALRKTYPDAQPYGEDGNFIYTDEKGVTRLYNQPNWNPFNLGDIASISPEIGEMLGGVVGGTVGGVSGTAVAPGPGTVGGTIVGAGTGATLGREGVQRGVNYLFGNDDSRTAGEQAADAGKTFAFNAAGEGAGMAVGKVAGKAWDAGKNWWNRGIIGEVDNAADVAKRAADFRDIGIEPTVGMVSGSDKTAKLEHALIPTRRGQAIEDRINDAFGAQGNEFNRIVSAISDRPLSKAEAGEALQKQAEAAKQAVRDRSEQLYREAGDKITSPAVFDSTADFLKRLHEERAGFGEFDKLTRGAQTDKVIEQTTAMLTDAQKGISFDQLKRMRSHIGQLSADETDKVMKSRLDDLYRSLGDDMQNTALLNGEDAQQAFNKANNHFRRFKDAEVGFGKGSAADTILKKNSDDVFNWATGGVQNGGNRIAQIRRTIERAEGGKETWNQVAAGLVDRLGRNSADEYDPGLFMRNWNKMSDEAKNNIFGGTANKQYKEDLDRLSRVGEHFTKYRKNANHSNTQAHKSALDSMNPFSKDNMIGTALGTTAVMASGGTAVAGLAAGAAKAGAANGAAGMMRASRVKLLTNPDTVNWLANIPKAEMQKGGLKAHLKKLVSIRANADNATAVAINDYFRDLNYQEEQ